MPGGRTSLRDAGMRRISRSSRWLLGGGLVLTGALAALFAGQAGSGASSTKVSTPAPTTPVTVPPTTARPFGGVTPVPVTPAPIPVTPVQNAPVARPHTSSRGS